MCGRFALTVSPAEVERMFDIAGLEPFPPRFNIAPTQPICVVRVCEHRRRGDLVRWGLVPHWVKDPGDFTLLINARSETARDKPAFRSAMRHRRCLVPASGFYEWQRTDTGKQPYWIAPAQGGVFGFAGVWETWMGKDGSEIDSAAILTTAANPGLSGIHHRVPVVIAPQDYSRWLDPQVDAAAVGDLLTASADGYFTARPVTDRVNSARNDGPELLVPAPGPEAAEADARPLQPPDPAPAPPEDQLDLF